MSDDRPGLPSRQELVVENMRLKAALRRIALECTALVDDKQAEKIVAAVLRVTNNAIAGRQIHEDEGDAT
jgi:hypothetical protein